MHCTRHLLLPARGLLRVHQCLLLVSRHLKKPSIKRARVKREIERIERVRAAVVTANYSYRIKNNLLK